MAGSKSTSEMLFEQFLTDHGLVFDPVPVAAKSRRPDYLVKTGNLQLLFEVKELREDDSFQQGPNGISTRTVGAHIRSKINESKKQVQYGAKQGIPSILLIYNALDPMHLFGTEDHDFKAAMHGEWTLLISKESGRVVKVGYGQNRSFREDCNTSFSALGHLAPRKRAMMVRLFANAHAKVPLPPHLPPCFETA